MRRSLCAVAVSALAVSALAVTACGGGSSKASTPPTVSGTNAITASTVPTKKSTVRVAMTTPPVGIAAPKGQWLRITRPDGKTQVAAVYRPNDSGAHPVVVVLHGTGGLPAWQLPWAAKLAAEGYVVVSGCYLDAPAGWDPGVFLACPGLPDGLAAPPRSKVLDAKAAYSAILDAAIGLDNVQTDAVGVVGLSVGGGVALSFDDPRVRAIVADSYYRETPGTIASPVLLLGFTQDPIVSHDKVVAFEQAQRREGKPVESKYYPGALHLALHRENTAKDATARTIAFLEQHLG